jgi:hypothetical protein
MNNKKLVYIIACTLVSLCGIARANEVKLWVTPYSSIRADYEAQLVQHLLRNSVDRFGDFDLSITRSEYSYDRALRELSTGEQLNVFANPVSQNISSSKYPPILLKEPIMKGLLGYRVLIVRGQDDQRLAQVSSIAELNTFSAGQVSYWIDKDIYDANNIKLATAPSLELVFDMLRRERLDYIPLGAGEVGAILSQYQLDSDNFTTSENLAIYYPFPVYLHISTTTPELKDRLEYALKKSKSDGSFNRLFSRFFSKTEDQLQRSSLRVVVLENPQLGKYASQEFPELVQPAQLITRDTH